VYSSRTRPAGSLAEDAGEDPDRLDHGRVADAGLFETVLPFDQILDV
jgi:hypothetical protein